MIIVAVVNTKGGVGKTTLSLALAVRASQDGARVRVIDLDPQRSMVEMFARRKAKPTDNPAVRAGDSAADAVEAIKREGADWVFIDGPPAFLTVVQEAIEAADFTVIPIKPSMLDLLATQDAVTLAREAGAAFVCVLNDVQMREKIADSARKTLDKAGVPVADIQMVHRVSHVMGATVGKSAAEVNGGKDKAAAEEIDALWREVKSAATKAAKARAKREAANG